MMDAGNILDAALATSLVVGGVAFLLRDRIFPPDSKGTGIQITRASTVPSSVATSRLGTPTGGGRKKKSRDFIKVMQENTGTAEDYAQRLSREFSMRFRNLKAMVADLEDYDMFLLDRLPADHLAVFVLATYGEGEPTDNASEFHQFLIGDNFSLEAYDPSEENPPTFSKEEQDGDSPEDASRPLQGLHYVVFGLGNKTYEHFNAVARRLDARLAHLGGTRVGDRGEGDDDANLEEDFLAWKENLWQAIAKELPGAIERGGDQDEGVAECQFECREWQEGEYDASKMYAGEIAERRAPLFGGRVLYDQKNPFLAPVKNVRGLFKGGERQCVHVELDLTGSSLRYAAGDHVAIWPTNPEQIMLQTAKWCGVDSKLDQVMSVINTDETAGKRHPFPCPTTYRTALRQYIDICGCPSRQFVAGLAAHVKALGDHPNAAAFLQHLGKDKDAYHTVVMEGHLVVAELLALANSKDPDAVSPLCIPFEVLVEGLGRMQPRYYSISSSPKQDASNVHVTAVVLRNSLKDGRVFHGLATNFIHSVLDRYAPGSSHIPVTADGREYFMYTDKSIEESTVELIPPIVRVPMFIRGSNFKLPRDPRTPIVMVGPGTGVAPFRGFLQERTHLARSGTAVGTTVLFYGCRRKDEDFLYHEEWDEMFGVIREKLVHPPNAPAEATKEELVAEIVCAFSREPNQPKVYVQQRLQERKAYLWRWLHVYRGYFYVCGDAKNMARAVNQALIDIAMEMGGMTEEAGQKWVKDLRSAGRYQEDVWS